MNSFWHWFIAAGTVLFTIWCVWLVRWSGKQGPTQRGDEELVGHVWDGDLEEWNNPAPRWWKSLYFITVAFALFYMIAFPGLGSFDGALGWSSAKQYDAEIAAANEKYEPLYERYASMPFDELQANNDAHQLGKSLFQNYCTTCHGSDARGATGFPNLTDNEWLYGATEQAITASITHGRSGIMPALAPALGGDAGIDNMVTYVRSLSGAVEADAGAAQSQAMFVALCSACHGADGTGIQAMGAPNLTDDNWLYGGDAAAIRQTLVEGRNGIMPAHGDLLGENRVRILAAYVASLSADSESL